MANANPWFSIQRRLDALRRRWRACWRTRAAQHCPIGAAVLIYDAAGRILLVQQTYLRPVRWLPPGGWVDWGETPEHAAVREAREEVGLHVAVERPLAIRGGGYGEITILFACRLLADPVIRLSDEIARAEFFDPRALPPLAPQTETWIAEALAAFYTKARVEPHPRALPVRDGEGSRSRTS